MYNSIKFPLRTRDKTKDLFIDLVEGLAINMNQVPVNLNQRNRKYTRELIDTFKTIAELNPLLFVLEKASPKSSRKESTTFGTEVTYRPCTTLLLSGPYFSYLHSHRDEMISSRKSRLNKEGKSSELRNLKISEYFMKHTFTVDGLPVSQVVHREENGRLFHTLTSTRRSSPISVITDSDNYISSLDFQINKLDWSIAGDSDLSICDFTACKPTVLSSIHKLPFSGTYPVISGIDRDIVKRICAAISNGSKQPLRIDGIKGHYPSGLTNKEVVRIIHEAIPVYALDSKEITKEYYKIESEMLIGILSKANLIGCGLIPLHDGVICQTKYAPDIREIMLNIGKPYSLKVDIKPLETKVVTKLRKKTSK
jgi:hypothetical protein